MLALMRVQSSIQSSVTRVAAQHKERIKLQQKQPERYCVSSYLVVSLKVFNRCRFV